MKNVIPALLGVLVLLTAAFFLLKSQEEDLQKVHGAEKAVLLYRIDSLKAEIFLGKMMPSLEKAKDLDDLVRIGEFYLSAFEVSDEKFELFFRRDFIPSVHPRFASLFSKKAEVFFLNEVGAAKTPEEWGNVQHKHDTLISWGFASR